MKRRGFHRITFLLAGVYNIGWGIFVALNPNWLFSFAGMEPINYPDVFACLGMVVGLYGIIYLEIARRPELGFMLAAVGLIGKILGPIGLLLLILQGAWKPATIVMCLTNDFVWWIPFALYLFDSWAFYKEDWTFDNRAR
ncbi:MAG TPA: hypothetical protein VK400_04115 [Pyrinomonadaceae bacterium]|nr:hypothetical protein [Pyrinomonadaceae bacterium]